MPPSSSSSSAPAPLPPPAECILNLLPKPAPITPHAKMYRSQKLKHARTLPPLGSTFGCFGEIHVLGSGKMSKKPHAYLGPPLHTQAADPKVFLKGGEKKQRVPGKVKRAVFHYPDVVGGGSGGSGGGGCGAGVCVDQQQQQHPKPHLPKERPMMGLQSGVDFIYHNAMEVIAPEAEGEEGEGEGVPDDNDHRKEMDYLHKPDYGKVPAYLRRIQAEIRREDALVEAFVKQQQEKKDGGKGHTHTEEEEEEEEEEELVAISEEERETLLVALKTKWDAINAAYQKTAHQGKFMSAGACRRKAKFEQEMQVLEQDIELLERGENRLYVRGGGGEGERGGVGDKEK